MGRTYERISHPHLDPEGEQKFSLYEKFEDEDEQGGFGFVLINESIAAEDIEDAIAEYEKDYDDA